MHAVLCTQFGPPDTPAIEDVPSPQPGKGEVVVRVRAAGVNSTAGASAFTTRSIPRRKARSTAASP